MMKTIYSNNSICSGRLIIFSHINSISEIDAQIVYIDTSRLFDLKRWISHKPKCILVGNDAVFSHIVSFSISLDIPVVLIERNEVAFFEGKRITIDFIYNTISCSEEIKDRSYIDLYNINAYDFNSVKTLDGVPVELSATVKSIDNANYAKKIGINNAGLICTEYLLSSLNNYENQLLDDICTCFQSGTVSIRLLDYDVGKTLICSNSQFIANRGIRAMGNNRLSVAILNQIKQIIAISERQKVCVVIPYVTTVDDVLLVEQILRENNGGKSLPTCAMLETLASFFSVRQLSKYVSSFSIGTNDLLSSFFAFDRNNISEGNTHFSPYNWGLFNMLSSFPEDCLSKTKVCGQLPLYPLMLEVLLSLGFRSFSIPSPMVNIIANRIRGIKTLPKSVLIKETENCDNDIDVANRLETLFK